MVDEGYSLFGCMIGSYVTARGTLGGFYNLQSYPQSGPVEKIVGDFSAMYHIAYPDLEVMSSAEAGFEKNSVLVRAVCRHTNICTYAAAFKKIVAVAD